MAAMLRHERQMVRSRVFAGIVSSDDPSFPLHQDRSTVRRRAPDDLVLKELSRRAYTGTHVLRRHI